jgi:hypothetical protein
MAQKPRNRRPRNAQSQGFFCYGIGGDLFLTLTISFWRGIGSGAVQLRSKKFGEKGSGNRAGLGLFKLVQIGSFLFGLAADYSSDSFNL